MKRFLLLFILFPIFIHTGFAKGEKGHKIEVKIKDFPGDTCMLAYHMGSKQYMSDTVSAKNGKIVFEGEEPLPGGIYLVVLPPENNYFEILVADDQHFSIETLSSDFIGTMKVSGSVENEVFYENLRQINVEGKKANDIQTKLKEVEKGSEDFKSLQAQLKEVYNTMNASRMDLVKKYPDLYYANVIRAMQEPEVPEAPAGADENFAFYYYRAHYWDKVDFSDEGLIRTPFLEGKLIRFVDKLTVQHYDTLKKTVKFLIDKSRANKEMFKYIAGTLLNKYAKSKIMCHDAVYVSIVDQVYKTGDAFWSDEETKKKIIERANALRHTMCGTVAPQMVMKDTSEKVRTMLELEAEYTILYFWDYDCGHCKKVTPALAKLFPRYKDKSVKMFAVSINGDINKWKQKLREYGMDNIGAINVQDHARKTGFDYFYDLRSTPRIFVLDKDKKILAKQISTEQLKDMLDNFLEMPDDTTDELKKELKEADKALRDGEE